MILLALFLFFRLGMQENVWHQDEEQQIAERENETETEVKTEIQAEKETQTAPPETEYDEGSTEIIEENSQNGTEIISDEYEVDDAEAFYHMPLTDEIKEYITGKSYPDTDETLAISYDDLEYVHVLHYNFEGQVQEGEIICNQAIAQDLTDIFRELYDSQYPIEKIRLIDAYDADDDASMEDNNTSCFNYRVVSGRTTLSNHAYGLAIDINPFYNPYIGTKNGETYVSPPQAQSYADRSKNFPYKIDQEDLCWQLFTEHGFTWGGSWNSVKDYQHFEKKLQ